MSLGFRSPTSAQAYAWPYIWEGDNVVLVSPSSTGKTLAYLLPLLAGCTTFNSSKWVNTFSQLFSCRAKYGKHLSKH